MNPLLQQFLSEARDFLQGIGEKLMQLEKAPADTSLMTELFRFVHTLKGNSGLFEFPEMTRVLHAGEDLLDAVRNGRVSYSQELADRLLDAMDFVGMLCDEIEVSGAIGATYAGDSARLTESLRQLNVGINHEALTNQVDDKAHEKDASSDEIQGNNVFSAKAPPTGLADIPENVRLDAYRLAKEGRLLHWLVYSPVEECFFQGEDPFFQARKTPQLLWGGIVAREPWPKLAEMDAYRCVLDFHILTTATRAAIDEYYRYMADRISIEVLSPDVILPTNNPNGESVLYEDLGADTRDSLYSDVFIALVAIQREILALPIDEPWHLGRMRAAATTLSGCLAATGGIDQISNLDLALGQSLAQGVATPLLNWFDSHFSSAGKQIIDTSIQSDPNSGPVAESSDIQISAQVKNGSPSTSESNGEVKFGRRAEDTISGAKSLKVDQAKIDRLMNLIGEMVVSKNALPYLAGRAESVFGVRELSREIKAQYSVINRIVEEMQDAIMQVRMMPVSFVFQRFPRLVRDTSRKLGKEVNLILEGEDTEADKNVIESLGDPLVHIVRNSLDHGFELPDVRRAAGKSTTGTLTIRANQESDRVIIEIVDDGKGIDPDIVKRKAYEKGILDEVALEKISDQEAVNLIFAAGFSTAEVISDLSGRGVGMDVVRTAVEKVNGTISLESEKGKGTRIRLSLPLSMAVTNVMIIESDHQLFGIPMDSVVETVRVPRSDIRSIKQSLATVLRGRIVPLKSINTLLNIQATQQANADDELAVLVVRLGDESVGLLVDNFRETIDIILKPMTGVMAEINAYAGSALMGDGSVLMVLNIKELLL
jgi:two-component system chemotaxis sensor kinase CheA